MPRASVDAATHAALSDMPEGVRQRAFDRYQKLRPHLEQNAPRPHRRPADPAAAAPLKLQGSTSLRTIKP
jgi:hypothetical protein